LDAFTRLFGSLLVFVYHCFDRIVINGCLNGLSRPEQVVHFVREVLGIPVVDREVLSQRTTDYQNWVESYARNRGIPIERKSTIAMVPMERAEPMKCRLSTTGKAQTGPFMALAQGLVVSHSKNSFA